MSNTKIVIDKEHLEKLILGLEVATDDWAKGRKSAFRGILAHATEIKIDQSIEERANDIWNKQPSGFDIFDKKSFIEGATQQQIIEQLKVKEKIICDKEWNEKLCDNCEFLRFNIVGHPGGSSVHTAKQHYCELGFFKEDF